MAKSVEDMIVPEKRRSIRDIPIPANRRRATSVPPPTIDRVERSTTQTSVSPGMPPVRRRRSRAKVWIVTFLSIFVLVFALLAFFNSSSLVYTPKSTSVAFSRDNFTAKREGEGSLLFSVVKLSRDLGKEVAASGETEVNRKASGTIVVYNNASAEPQRLIATTRFEAANGKVYRVAKDIVVPGKMTVGGVVKPGTLETLIYADEAGETYNMGLSDFTLPGLKGSERYNTIYARSKTAMAGGFVGKEKGVSEEDKTRVSGELETTLKTDLTSEALSQVPDGFVLIPALSSVVYEDLPQSQAAGADKVTINKKGNFYGVMFKTKELSNSLTKKKVTINKDESVDLDLANLTFAFTNPQVDLASVSEINFSVSGTGLAVWSSDEVALKADLVGHNKKDLPLILNNYPSIVSARPIIRPFWKSSFPSDASKIMVERESTDNK